MTRIITAICAAALVLWGAAFAAIYVKIPGVPGDAAKEDQIKVESWSWGETNPSSSEGPGVLTISLDRDSAAYAELRRLYESETEIPEITVISEKEKGRSTHTYLQYKLERCFIKSWSTSGDADDRPTEEVSFYYNKIAAVYARTKD